MSSPVISVKPYDSVEKVIRLMNEHNISQIPVISGNKVVGSITERTLVRQSLEYDDIYGHKVVEVMEEPFPIVNEDEDLEVVKYLLEDHPAVLVQDKAGKIVGIITRLICSDSERLYLGSNGRCLKWRKNRPIAFFLSL